MTKNIKLINNELNSKKHDKCKIDDKDKAIKLNNNENIEDNMKDNNNDEVDKIKYNEWL